MSSSTPIYAVTGVTGNVGKALAQELHSQGVRVRGIVRDAAKSTDKTFEPFEVREGFHDAAGLTSAFKGVAGVFIMTPPLMQSNDVRGEHAEMVKAIVQAIEASGVSKVVMLSSVGAENPSGTGSILKLHDLEVALGKLKTKVDVAYIRAGYFMSNTAGLIPLARDQGFFPALMTPDMPLYLVSTNDIGVVAAKTLVDDAWHGQRVIQLEGPQRLTYNQLGETVSKVLGKPVNVVGVPAEQHVATFKSIGASENGAVMMAELVKGWNAGEINFHANIETVKGTTTYEQFVKSLLA